MIELIPDWKQAYRFSSVIAAAALAAFDALTAALPSLHDALGTQTVAIINVVCAVGIAFFRVIQQQSPPTPPDVKAALVDKAMSIPVQPPESKQ
jgi:hypothetical protein